MSKRVVVYIDGLNFYSGLRASNWKKYYWLDLMVFFSKFLKPYQILLGVDYFSSAPIEEERKLRQQQFFLANRVDPRFKVHFGALEKRRRFCGNCQEPNTIYVEKESDLRMGARMIADVVHNRCDVSIVVSGDRDFLPAIQTIHELKTSHKVVVFFPPGRISRHLKGITNHFVNLRDHEQKFTTSSSHPRSSSTTPSSKNLKTGPDPTSTSKPDTSL